jgi:purine-binding chemotaxis protein CheW
VARVTDQHNKHLTCRLGAEEYAIPVAQVREIVSAMTVTTVPGTSAHVVGVVNLRGKVIPIINLRARLGLPAVPNGPRTCVVVCHDGTGMVGVIVDSVVEVMQLRPEDLEPPPTIANADVTALAKVKDRVVIVLDLRTTIREGAAAA